MKYHQEQDLTMKTVELDEVEMDFDNFDNDSFLTGQPLREPMFPVDQ